MWDIEAQRVPRGVAAFFLAESYSYISSKSSFSFSAAAMGGFPLPFQITETERNGTAGVRTSKIHGLRSFPFRSERDFSFSVPNSTELATYAPVPYTDNARRSSRSTRCPGLPGPRCSGEGDARHSGMGRRLPPVMMVGLSLCPSCAHDVRLLLAGRLSTLRGGCRGTETQRASRRSRSTTRFAAPSTSSTGATRVPRFAVPRMTHSKSP